MAVHIFVGRGTYSGKGILKLESDTSGRSLGVFCESNDAGVFGSTANGNGSYKPLSLSQGHRLKDLINSFVAENEKLDAVLEKKRHLECKKQGLLQQIEALDKELAGMEEQL